MRRVGTTGRRRRRLVAGVVLVVVGLFATVAGLAIVVLVGIDGSVGIPATRFSSDGYALTLPQLDVPSLPGDRRVTLDVSVRGSDEPVFVGVGPSPAVDTYLAGVPHDVIQQIDWPGAARTAAVTGTDHPEDPAGEAFWVTHVTGDAPGLQWTAEPGDWTLVLMRADAGKPLDVTVTGSVTIPGLGPLGFVVLAFALGVLVAGIWLTLRAAKAPAGR